jgi:hypothetical protein
MVVVYYGKGGGFGNHGGAHTIVKKIGENVEEVNWVRRRE